ncbi:hypothetical protein [Roseicyclus sp.]|jgi:deoxyribodipyrimidine photolyase
MTAPLICWTHRDFRVTDDPAGVAARARGVPVIPVVLCGDLVEGHARSGH